MNTPQLQLLPIDKLVIDQNIRVDYGDLAALASTFQDDQPDVPPTVHPNGQGYVVEEGNRRVAAAKYLGITHLWCVVKPSAPTSLKVRQLIADLQHKKLEPLERAGALRAILDEDPTLTQAGLAEMVGRSPTEISQSLALLDLCEEGQQALARGDISESIAELLIPLDQGTQERVLPKILGSTGQRSRKPTVNQARRVIQSATMTEEERQAQEDATLAQSLARLAEPVHPADAFDHLLREGEPAQGVHLLYYVAQAERELEQAWRAYNLDGCSEQLLQQINRTASRLVELAQTIEEHTR